jgi:hypothetical protein
MPLLYSNRPPCRSTRVYPLRNVRYLREAVRSLDARRAGSPEDWT